MEFPAIGIDLGTTYCCVGVFHEGKVHIIQDADTGDYTIPSYVSIDSDGDEAVGWRAKENAYRNSDNTIYDVKRILGRTFSDPDLQNDIKFWPFNVQEEDGLPVININGDPYHPEQISAKILAYLKSRAESFLYLPPGSVTKAVITVPAYFNVAQRQATVDAGELAGLEVLTILNEPTAAAIAFAMVNKEEFTSKKILVYDLGGGTFDIAVLDIQPNNLEVLGVNGNTHLGGEDFDRKLMEHCATVIKAETGIDMLKEKDSTDKLISSNFKRSVGRLQYNCEQYKKYFTTGVKVTIAVDALVDGHDLVTNVSREQFDGLNLSIFEETIHLVDDTLKELDLNKNDIDEVVLVGGSTRIPKIQQLLTEYFTRNILNKSLHPDQAVAYGAAVQAAMLTGQVSLGGIKFEKIQDVTPMTVWMQMESSKPGLSIPKNSKIPTRKSAEYITVADNQTMANFNVYQGNDMCVISDNMLLGVIYLDGIPQNKAGKEPVDITMEIDTMGILHVVAVCRSTGNSNSFSVVTKKRRLSNETKAKLRSDSFEDALRRKRPVLHKGHKFGPKESGSDSAEASAFFDSQIINLIKPGKNSGLSSTEILNSVILKASHLDDSKFNLILQKCEDNGVDFNAKDDFNNTTLHDAVINSYERVIFFLVKIGININPKNAWQETPLHLASTIKNTDFSLKVIQYLIDNGADVCAKDNKNHTFLQTFIAHSDHSPVQFDLIVKYLHVKGYLDLFNIPGGAYETTSFQLEVARQEISSESLSLLYTNGVNFNASDRHGDSILFYAISRQRSFEFISGLIYQIGIDYRYVNSTQKNVLHITSMRGSLQALNFLLGLRTFTNINGQDMKGNTPLHYALRAIDSEYISLEKCRVLVSNGANVNATNSLGETPLHLVAKWNDFRMSCSAIKYLIENGANAYLKDSNNATFLYILLAIHSAASSYQFRDLIKFLHGKNLLKLFEIPSTAK